MFGLGKSASKPKTKKSSKLSLPGKEWLLKHVEKVAIGIFLALTGYLVYDGFSAKRYDSSKSPEDLYQKTQSAQREIETGNHWTVIKADRPMPNDFVKLVKDARNDVDAAPYAIANIPERALSISGEKRGDPELYPPIELQAQTFVGAIAINSPKPSPADALLNAPPVASDKLALKRKPPTATTPPRTLIPVYDLGYQHKPGAAPAPVPSPIPGRPVRTVENKVVPKVTAFNVLTAAVPHEQMADSYRKEFASAASYHPDRDSPNYLGYEVQRADVTDNPDRELDEADWQEAKGCTVESQLKQKSLWAGVCDEVAVANFVVDQILTMSIPPILLADYRSLASHPLIPRIDLVRIYSAGEDNSDPTEMTDPDPSEDTGDGSGMPSPAAAEDPKNIPKQLELTEYKLLRFVDFDVAVGRTYRYRVRLALEDPNYPRAKSYAPRTSDMKPDVVTRVQAIEMADADAASKMAPNAKFERNSKRYTAWSQASSPVVTQRPVELYGSQVVGMPWTPLKPAAGKPDLYVESMPVKANLVYAEWAQEYGMLIPRKTIVERGMVLSGPTAEPGLDAIHPITKVIKWVAGFKFKVPVTIVDIRGGQPLAAEKRGRDKDPLPSGGEIIAFDPQTGELVISREFEAATQFQMLGFIDEKPAETTATP